MQDIRFIEFKKEDLGKFHEFLNILLKHLESVDSLGRVKFKEGYAEHEGAEILKSLGEKDKIFFAEAEGNKVGVVVLKVKKVNPDSDDIGSIDTTDGFIEKLIVLPEYRGKGIGTKLLNFAEEYLIKNGCEYLKLSVFADNVDALKLYERHNYKMREYRLIKKVHGSGSD